MLAELDMSLANASRNSAERNKMSAAVLATLCHRGSRLAYTPTEPGSRFPAFPPGIPVMITA